MACPGRIEPVLKRGDLPAYRAMGETGFDPGLGITARSGSIAE